LFDITLVGDHQPWTHFGVTMAKAGDINGDGYNEILISSYGDSTLKGKIFIYTSNPTWVFDDEEEEVIKHFYLSQNYPNPFNSVTSIQYTVAGRQNHPIHTTLKIYNIRGQLIRTLVNKVKESGTYKVIWDGKDNSGKEVASGIYFYQLRMGSLKEGRKMFVIK